MYCFLLFQLIYFNNLKKALRGSGSGGAITLDDVKNIPMPNLNFSSQTSTFIKNSMMRKTIAKRCVESKTTIPHYYLNIEPEIDRLLSMRRELNENQSECKVLFFTNIFIFIKYLVLFKKWST